MRWQISVDKADPAAASLDRVDDVAGDRVERFALTANILTYARTGEKLGYWSLFPATSGRGIVPVWGEVKRSDGRTISGLMPMASHAKLMLEPSRTGLRETSAYRATVSPVYNRYFESDGDIAARETAMVLRPLLVAGVTLDAWLRADDWRGAGRAIVLSASSRTAMGFAMLARDAIRLVGMTAPGNCAFVARTGLYDAVVPYGASLDAGDSPAIIVDFAGDAGRVAAIEQNLAGRCAGVVRIGGTHWRESGSALAREGAFFAPDHVARLVAENGAAAFEARMVDALHRFRSVSRDWLSVRHLDGPDAILAGYRDLAHGRTDPRHLLVARPHGETA